ncbi:midnolin-A-like [Saccostrea echinata]|uniref:midnolin-A-like n=1 Tax=Saccostrea echinata TaxID=191078 RepID=UPI002A80090F|nr:midnolin-A-like [Saccostrea echinata]
MDTYKILIQPATGGSFDVQVPHNETVQGLQWTLSRMFNIHRDRITLLHQNKHLKHGFLRDYDVEDGSTLTLIPSMETGLSFHKKDSGVMQALESLTDSQISEFLSGRAPLVLAMRLGDHMMFIQLQLSTQSGSKRARPSPVQLPTPQNMTVHDHQDVPSPTYIPHTGSNGIPYNLHQFRSFPDSEKKCQTSSFNQGVMENTSGCQGAVIESVENLGRGMYSGTFSGTLDPSVYSVEGRPRRDLTTIIHILNDLLSAVPHYKPHSFLHQPQQSTTDSQFKERRAHNPNCTDEVDNANIRSKVRHLKMMMAEKKQRRKNRRTSQAPYQWPRKQDRSFKSDTSSDCLNSENQVPQDSYKNLTEETVAV